MIILLFVVTEEVFRLSQTLRMFERVTPSLNNNKTNKIKPKSEGKHPTLKWNTFSHLFTPEILQRHFSILKTIGNSLLGLFV